MKRSILAAISLLAVLAAGCDLDGTFEKYAIVYGVAEYEGTDNDLYYPDDDANDMETMLASQGYSVIRRINSAATRANLEADVAVLSATVKENDLFLFYYSGHGGQYAVGQEPAGGDSATEWIFLYGSVDPLDLTATYSDDQLLAAFAPITARKKVIILDSCNSGGFIGNTLEADGIPPAYNGTSEPLAETLWRAISLYANFGDETADIPPEEALVLSASGEREVSWEGLHENGVFTYFLLESAARGDSDGDGFVTVTEAFNYSRFKINLEWNLYYGLGYIDGVFSPHVSGGPVDYVLFSVP